MVCFCFEKTFYNNLENMLSIILWVLYGGLLLSNNLGVAFKLLNPNAPHTWEPALL